MSEQALVFVGGAGAGILTFLTILLFRHLLSIGKQIRRSVFVTTVTILIAIFGLAVELAVNSRLLLVVILTLSMGAIGAIISLGVSLVLYRNK